MSKKKYAINKFNIFTYRTNQKDEILANSELNKSGFPEYWPTKNEMNQVVFISFVDACIYDKEGKLVSEEKATFDILDTEKFDAKEDLAQLKVKYLSALLSPEYKVKGGVYVNGEYYTGQMRKPYATRLYKNFMKKYFCVEDKESFIDKFPKDKNGCLKFIPVHCKDKRYVIFSALNAKIIDVNSGEVVEDNINFELYLGQLLDLNNKHDLMIAETIFKMLNSHYLARGFYYRGTLIKDKLSLSDKLFYEKSFVKKNFTIEDLSFLKDHVTLNKDGSMIFFPMKNRNRQNVVVSFRNGKTPFADEFENFDIISDIPFDPRDVSNQYKIQIIDRILQKNDAFSGELYLDGVLLPNLEKKSEIERRKSKVEKALKVRIDGDDDYITIFNKFTTDDREKLLILSDRHRTSYPYLDGVVPKRNRSYSNKKGEVKNIFIFDNVNILDNDGNYLLKENYSASYDGAFKPNEIEQEILLNAFKKHALVRGGIYYRGRNINRRVVKLTRYLPFRFLRNNIPTDVFSKLVRSTKMTGCTYKMEKKNGMFVHWPTFDNKGNEILLSVVDANVWFKNGRSIVKAVNDMNFDIHSGETFGLVGESGSGKTTISRAILGINPLQKGGIYWKGRLISSGLKKREAKAVKKNVQMIFQDPAASLNERANIDYIVSEGLYSFHLFKNKEERLTKVVNMLREVGLLPEHLSRYPHEFSGGQRQRIGIARALVIEPELVLADEPISALDVSIRAQVLNLLKKLQVNENLTYLFIAHDLSIIRYISDRIAVMHNGYVVELGPAEEIYSNPIHPYTKALLTAIPQPDPKSKDKRKKLVYNQGDIDYAKCKWVETTHEHFVLMTDDMIAKRKK